jgi:carbon storage regulator
MLCLSRKVGERIVIDGNVVVRVLEIQRGRVRLGVEAPRQMPVVRAEIELRKAG